MKRIDGRTFIRHKLNPTPHGTKFALPRRQPSHLLRFDRPLTSITKNYGGVPATHIHVGQSQHSGAMPDILHSDWTDKLIRHLDSDDLRLDPAVFTEMSTQCKPHVIDLFASSLNALLPCYNAT
jgi:hypothetical protein